MTILITNDDGYEAPGLTHLKEALRESHTVYMVAPEGERSAKSHSLTIIEPLTLKQIGSHDYITSGGPADCVKLGLGYILEQLGIAADVVISGINNGANLGSDVIYSGTVGAAREGVMNGVPSVAFSMGGDFFVDKPFREYAQVAMKLVEYIMEAPLADMCLLNVNFPFCPVAEIRGIQITRLGDLRSQRTVVTKRSDSRGVEEFWLKYERFPLDDPETDVAAFHNNFISITPMTIDSTYVERLKEMDAFFREFGI